MQQLVLRPHCQKKMSRPRKSVTIALRSPLKSIPRTRTTLSRQKTTPKVLIRQKTASKTPSRQKTTPKTSSRQKTTPKTFSLQKTAPVHNKATSSAAQISSADKTLQSLMKKAYKDEQRRLSRQRRSRNKQRSRLESDSRKRKQAEQTAAKLTAADKLNESKWALQAARLDARTAMYQARAAAARAARSRR